jgi:hypothetical protein
VLEEIDWASKHYLIVDDFVGIRQLLRRVIAEQVRVIQNKVSQFAFAG